MHKDGIRRAVVTNMGSSLARYFDRHDLKQIFKLNQVGQCDFLDRLGEKGRTRGSDVFHKGVLGISSHDALYTENVGVSREQNGCQAEASSQENPFSSPSKAISLTSHEVSGSNATKGGRQVLGKSQRVLNKGGMTKENVLIPLRKLGEKTNIVPSSDVKSQRKETSTNEGMKYDIKEVFIRADRFIADGRLEYAMEILMDAMDNLYGDLEMSLKMQLHERMSSIAYELRWL